MILTDSEGKQIFGQSYQGTLGTLPIFLDLGLQIALKKPERVPDFGH
jgi:hypothetical protein